MTARPDQNDTPSRDSASTKARLVAAVGQLVQEKGFGAIGVNAVARQAKTDKVMIYRYFGGLPELVRRFSEDGDFWWSVDDMLQAPFPAVEKGLPAALTEIFRRHVSFLRAHPVTLEVLAWEMSERNALTQVVEEVREHRNAQLLDRLADRYGLSREDIGQKLIPAFALLGGAANYLTVRARRTPIYGGIDLRSEDGWTALIEAATSMASAIGNPSFTENGE